MALRIELSGVSTLSIITNYMYTHTHTRARARMYRTHTILLFFSRDNYQSPSILYKYREKAPGCARDVMEINKMNYHI